MSDRSDMPLAELHLHLYGAIWSVDFLNGAYAPVTVGVVDLGYCHAVVEKPVLACAQGDLPSRP